MAKERPFPGVVVPVVDFDDYRTWRTFFEHLCDALVTIQSSIPSGDAFPEGGTAYQVLHGQPASPRWSLVDLVNSVSGVLAVANGGTNLNAYTTGDLLYASSSTVLAKLPIGDAGDLLSVSGGLPAWVSPASLGITNYWQRDGAGFVAPATITDLVSIGSLTAPYNSHDLCLWHATGLAHCYATAAAGTGITLWEAESSFAVGSTAEQVANAHGAGRGVWTLRTETANAIFMGYNGVDYVALGLNISGFPALIPLDATASLGGIDTSPNERWHSLHLQSASPNQGITFGASGSTHGYVYHDATNMYVRAASGILRLRSDATSPGVVQLRPGDVLMAYAYWHTTGSVRRFNPGVDNAVDLGGSAGTSGSAERWRNCYLTGLDNWASAAVTAAATITVTTNLSMVSGNTNIDYITTTGILAGTVIILIFSGTPTVNHNSGAPGAGTAAIYLAGSANFAATANDTLTLVWNGTVWSEIARTVI